MLNDLISEYKRCFPNSNKNDCLKISYKYNGVDVNLFFDSYDEKSLALSIILNYEKECYFTPIDIKYFAYKNIFFLKDCPGAILCQIMSSERKLNLFCKNMRERIENYIAKSKNQQINLKCDYSDECFRESLGKSKNNICITPFLHHIRNTKMSKEQFIRLKDELIIDKETLIKLQREGKTIVTTNDPLKRKTLTMVLDEVGYKI